MAFWGRGKGDSRRAGGLHTPSEGLDREAGIEPTHPTPQGPHTVGAQTRLRQALLQAPLSDLEELRRPLISLDFP